MTLYCLFVLFDAHVLCFIAKGSLTDGVLCACVCCKAVTDVIIYNEIIQESGLMGFCSHYKCVIVVVFTARGCMFVEASFEHNA